MFVVSQSELRNRSEKEKGFNRSARYPETTATSCTPAVRRAERLCSISGLPPTRKSAFGLSSVIPFIRRPRPAAKISALIYLLRKSDHETIEHLAVGIRIRVR